MKSLKPWGQSAGLAALLLAAVCPVIAGSAAADLKDGIPSDVFLAVYGRHNPERDYQREYYQEVWKAVEDSKIISRVTQLIQSRMSDGDVEQMLEVRDTLQKAVAPIQWEQLANLQEVAYGQKFDGPFTQQIVLMRFPEDGASSLVEGITNLLKLAEEAAGGEITVENEDHQGTALTTLRLPGGIPFAPVVGLKGDLFLFSTTPEMAKRCLTLLGDPSAESKFDDARVTAALGHLPKSEDALVFFDGVALNQQLNGIVSFIQGVGAGDENAMRVATLLESILKEINIVDHEVTVEYTEEYRNLSATFGKSSAYANDTVLGKMVGSQTPFKDWSKWVPADASSFSMSTGASLHPLYEWITTKIPEQFPESKEGFAKFAAIQDQFDLHLDEDLLQSFSGESVSIALPGPITPFGPTAKSASFMRCSKPDRINDLINRAVEALMKIPQVEQQNITIEESDVLKGFMEVKAPILAMMGGATPVFGFQDDWMAIGSHADAIQKINKTRGGEGQTFASTEKFKKFGLDVQGEVYSISYANTGESIRQAAQGLQQIGSMLPMMMMMAGNQGDGGPDLAPIQDFLELLPSVGRIVAKFDFIDASLSVCKPGPTEGTYIRHGVTTLRPPKSRAE